MPSLPQQPTLQVIQDYVRQLEDERGFSHKPVIEQCLLLAEETGELCKAVRKREQLQMDANSKVGTIAEELADILIVMSSVANRYGVDLEQALRDKEEINHRRVWR